MSVFGVLVGAGGSEGKSVLPFAVTPTPFGGIDGAELVHGAGGRRRRDDDGGGRQNPWRLTCTEHWLAAGDRKRTPWCTLALMH